MKLNGHFFNNIYLGGPGGPPPGKAPAKKVAVGENALQTSFQVKAFVSQWDSTGDQAVSPRKVLPGTPEEFGPNHPTYGPLATYVNFTQNNATYLDNLLDTIRSSGLWTGFDYTESSIGWFLASFSRAASGVDPAYTTYDSTGNYYEADGTTIHTGPLVPNQTYWWKGWGVMYFIGTERPETVADYPFDALADQPVYMGHSTFTFDYVRTEMEFVYEADGVRILRFA